MKRIHIVGASPRAGTTLLAEAIVACCEIDVFYAHEARIFEPPPRAGSVFLSKCPRDVMVIEPALAQDPDLYCLYLLRDPRNIITSKHRRDPDRYWAGLKFWKAYTPCARRLAGHPRFVTVRYETLVAVPDRIQAELLSRLPFLVPRLPFSRFHEVAQPAPEAVAALGGVRPIAPGRADKWREHLPRVAGQIALHGSIAGDLIEFGYEPDDAWLRELDGVEPDLRPGRWPEYFTPESLARLLSAPSLAGKTPPPE